MKYQAEYRDGRLAKELSAKIHQTTRRSWTLMEICGGQTHAIMRFGLEELLPKEISLVHGPGCPVCVTPTAWIDKALEIALVPGVLFCSFGDMLRVPGTREDLFAVKSRGADVRIVYSPLDAVKLAEKNPEKQVVFFAVGFETTAPATAMAVSQTRVLGIKNFSLLVSHVLVPPAMEQLLSAPQSRVQGFLAAGHVCAVMGYREYERLVLKYRIPIVVTGFEPIDILEGIYLVIRQLEEGRYEVENQYSRAVFRDGNGDAQNLLKEVFEIIPRQWRGLGEIPGSGFGLSQAYREFDAESRFGPVSARGETAGICISGEILQGLKKPNECPGFGKACTPEHPLGATMVSSEGTCSAYYRYRPASVAVPVAGGR